ncbi:MAG: hypothetical protein EBT03_12735 [Betaproteobacteria bacterium]|nr:hypothetical protein [Betaproteobacteria bacterium]NCA18141.1 hypothetical protein [Betaproteobacteria bacterium]
MSEPRYTIAEPLRLKLRDMVARFDGGGAPPPAMQQGREYISRRLHFLHLCKTTSEFAKGTTATLNVWEDGTPPNETQTSGFTIENVVNKYATIAANKFVSVARHGNGYWYVIAAECS